MKRLIIALFVLWLAALYVYVLGTPLVSRTTGIGLRTVSLLAGLTVFLSGAALMIAGGISARGRRGS